MTTRLIVLILTFWIYAINVAGQSFDCDFNAYMLLKKMDSSDLTRTVVPKRPVVFKHMTKIVEFINLRRLDNYTVNIVNITSRYDSLPEIIPNGVAELIFENSLLVSVTFYQDYYEYPNFYDSYIFKNGVHCATLSSPACGGIIVDGYNDRLKTRIDFINKLEVRLKDYVLK